MWIKESIIIGNFEGSIIIGESSLTHHSALLLPDWLCQSLSRSCMRLISAGSLVPSGCNLLWSAFSKMTLCSPAP